MFNIIPLSILNIFIVDISRDLDPLPTSTHFKTLELFLGYFIYLYGFDPVA